MDQAIGALLYLFSIFISSCRNSSVFIRLPDSFPAARSTNFLGELTSCERSFRVGIAGQNPKLGDRVEVRNDPRLLADAFLHIGAVEGKSIGILTLAVDRKLAGICGSSNRNRAKTAAGRAVTRTARSDRGYANLQGEKVRVGAAIQGNLCAFLVPRTCPSCVSVVSTWAASSVTKID